MLWCFGGQIEASPARASLPVQRMEEKCLLMRLRRGFKTFEGLVQASISLNVHIGIASMVRKKINTFLQRCPSRTEEPVYIFEAGLYLQEQAISSTAASPQSADQ